MADDYVGNYYREFGVSKFHAGGFFGRGMEPAPGNQYQVKMYVIDSGFDDIQSHTDLSTVEVIRFSTDVSAEIPSHGSLVCSLLAAPENGHGVVGICPRAKIYLGDVGAADGGFPTRVSDAVDDAVGRGVDIISISPGSATCTDEIRMAVEKAAKRGILIFSPVGDSGENCPPPDDVITVGSVDIQRKLSVFNARDDRIDLFAPGENYYLPSNAGPVLVNGTSFSSSFAAGLAALYISQQRENLQDSAYIPSRDEMVSILRGGEFLGDVYIEKQNSATEGLPPNIFVIGIVFFFVVVVGLVAFSLTTPPSKMPQPLVD